MYKCVDASGKVSYSDKARPGCEAVGRRGAEPGAPKAPGAAKAPGAPKAPSAAAKATPARKAAPAARAPAEAAPPPMTESQLALRCRGLRQERAWLAGKRGAGVAGREERLGQVERALRDCP